MWTCVTLLRGIDDDDIRFDLHEIVVIEAPFAHHLAREAIDYHITQSHESLGNVYTLGMIEVQRNAILAAIEIIEKTTAVQVWGVVTKVAAAENAQRIKACHGFDTNNLRPVVGEPFGANRGCTEPGKIQHANTPERLWRGHHLVPY